LFYALLKNRDRTNNALEARHNTLAQIIGSNRGFYKFCSKLAVLEIQYTTRYAQLMNGAAPARRNKNYEQAADRIRRIVLQGLEGRLIFDYVRSIAHNIQYQNI
jgi:hypothetical protein